MLSVNIRAITIIAVAHVLWCMTCTLARANDSLPIQRVVLIVADDLKADVLSCYGNQTCSTPHLDRLAREGLVFNRAYCQGTWCAPSRQSFMYSRYIGKSRQTLGEVLRSNGWYSARVGKIFHMRVPGDIIAGTDGEDVAACWSERFNSPGLEAHTPGNYACLNLNISTTAMEGRQSTAMPHRMFVTVRSEGDGSDQPDAKSANRAIELLRAHKDGPFFLALGFVRPHYPMVAPAKYFDQYDHSSIQLPHVPADDLEDIPQAGLRGTRNGNNGIGKYPENQQRMWAGYYASVSFMDEQLGKVLAELERLGIRDQTTVIFTSDHGYHLGEHTLWQKKNFHEHVTRVPLIIDAPDCPNGETNAMTELVDLYPTVLDLAGLSVPNDIDGKSLRPILSDPLSEHRRSVLSSDVVNGKREYAVRTAKYAYIRYIDGSEELYDMEQDPGQYKNLVRFPESRGTLTEMRALLNERVAAAK